MRAERYLRIRKDLKSLRDLSRVTSKYGIRRGDAFSILVQKKIEYVRKNYRRFESRAEEVLDFWEKNRSFPPWLKLPPVMKLRVLFKAMGYTKNRIARLLRNPEGSEFEKEIFDAIFSDFVYSPIASENLAARGKIGEMILEKYLVKSGVEFMREKDIKSGATPDFLILSDCRIGGKRINWMESKSMFGDVFAHKNNLRQLKNYAEKFGSGAVIYWHGYVNDISDESYLILGDLTINCEEKKFLKDMVIKICDEGEFSWKGGGDLKSERFVRELIRFFKSCKTSIAAEEKFEVKKALERFGYVVDIE